MKKTQTSFKNKAALISIIRNTLVGGIIVCCVAAGNAQVTTTRASEGLSEQKATPKNQSVSTRPDITLQRIQPEATREKMGEHAPDFNDENFQTKKAEWIKNYPEEYEAFLKKTATSGARKVQTPQAVKPHQKIAEHAPFLDDPDYAAKKAEWMKNYPQEYEQVMQEGQHSKIK